MSRRDTGCRVQVLSIKRRWLGPGGHVCTPSRVDSRHLRDHTAGTIIPSITLDVAAAVVDAGSYFECIYLGPTAALGGSWS